MDKKINWGIIGPGKIAHSFAADLKLSENAIFYGVASRDIDKAKSFAEKYNAITYFNSYEELAQCPEIDVVYVATPHNFHYQNTLLCLKNGKSVLCEKPMGIDTKEVQTMIDEAKVKNLFLMEGMWTRFIPATIKLLDLIDEGVIGDIISVHADFGFKPPFNPEGRIFNKKLAGGSLLDIGIYPVYLSLLLLGYPQRVYASARFSETGVDSSCYMMFDYENSAKALLYSTVEVNSPLEALIHGSKGSLKLHHSFHHSEKISLYQDGALKNEYDVKYEGNGLFHEIEEVNRCLLNSEKQSSGFKPEHSLQLIRLLDQVKDEIGLKY